MNKLLKEQFGKSELNDLEVWSKKLWEKYSQDRASNFAQQGYEDKGWGHIERIVSNVLDLLENYPVLYYGNDAEEKSIIDDFFIHIEPNWTMFLAATYLHDIGMCFPGIFKALENVVSKNGESALHISEIIHKYHHYGSFILLLELNNIPEISEESKETLTGDEHKGIEENCPYLVNIPKKNMYRNIEALIGLRKALTPLYEKYFDKKKIDEKEFRVILAILCLLHREIDLNYVQSILRSFQKSNPNHEETIRYFNKWWDFFNRARQRTESFDLNWLQKKLEGSKPTEEIFPELIDITEKENKKKISHRSKLSLLFVEALLQYGDKTDITIARLARKPLNDTGNPIPLKSFLDDIQWDNRKGGICTDMAKKVLSDFARFRACRFIPLFMVSVKNTGEKTKTPGLDVVMHYFRFPNDKDVFPLLRFHNESDFYDLKFLDVIRIHIPLLLWHSNFISNENSLKCSIIEIKFIKEEIPFPSLIDILKNLILPFLDKLKKNIEKKREWGKLQSSNIKLTDPKTQNIVTGILNAIEIDKEITPEDEKQIIAKLKKLDYTDKITLINCLQKSFSPRFYYHEDTEDNSKLRQILTGYIDTQEGLQILQQTIEESRGQVQKEDMIPYTPQNKEAISRYSITTLDPEARNKAMGKKKIFYETGDIIVPYSFEAMAILNLFLQEE